MEVLSKRRVIRDFNKLDPGLKSQVLKSYPHGFGAESISYLSINGKRVPAVPFETSDTFYLLRLPASNPSDRIGKKDAGTNLEEPEEPEEMEEMERIEDSEEDFTPGYQTEEEEDEEDFYH